jgi:hypothetical protein
MHARLSLVIPYVDGHRIANAVFLRPVGDHEPSSQVGPALATSPLHLWAPTTAVLSLP